MKKIFAILMLVMVVVSGCTSNLNEDEIGGTLTVVTKYTDAEERFKDVEEGFIAMYPEVEDIVWESTSGDYDEYITQRMTTGDYGDVLLVPFSMTSNPSELENFIEPLGTVEDVSKDYTFADQAMYDGNTYALPISVNILGMLYNEDVFTDAGIEEMPTSSDEVYEACKKIQDDETTCWYSNLNTLPMLWSGAITSYGGEQYMSDILEQGTIVQEGQPYREIFDFIYEMITSNYTEADPITGDIMKSEQMVANGEAGFIIMGSQSLAEVKEMSDNPDAIKMAPFPVETDGKQHMPIGPDELIGVSNTSSNKETAKAFLKYLLSSESGYAYSNGGFSPEVDGNKDAPSDLAYQLEEFDSIRTIAYEDADVVTKFYAISADANMSSISTPITDLISVATNDGDYDQWLDRVEESWSNAVKKNQ